MTKRTIFNDPYIMNTLEQLVPQNHLVRKLNYAIDWDFIYPLVEKLYSPVGRPSIDPVVLFKMIVINKVFGIHSMRKTCREIEVNIAYRWFLGISFEETVPNYSTWSQNYIRRYNDSNVFDEIFMHIIMELHRNNFLKMDIVYVDSTHRKANANKNKSIDAEVEIEAKEYEKELLEEINLQREADNKKKYDSIRKTEIEYDENGNEKLVTQTKHVKLSVTDPESGAYHKGEHEKCYAYSLQTICEGNGFVLAVNTVPGNIHDSVSFFDAYRKLENVFPEKIGGVCLDAGYKTPAIARRIIEDGRTPYLPYKRPMTGKGLYKKKDYKYEEETDRYICPAENKLEYKRITRDGYKQYKSNKKECGECPLLEKCTKAKKHEKLIQRHIWEEYIEQAEIIRHAPFWKDIYSKRKETIERVFAENKENSTLRFTRLRGLKKNQHDALMIFACHNLKKMANWKWK